MKSGAELCQKIRLGAMAYGHNPRIDCVKLHPETFQRIQEWLKPVRLDQACEIFGSGGNGLREFNAIESPVRRGYPTIDGMRLVEDDTVPIETFVWGNWESVNANS